MRDPRRIVRAGYDRMAPAYLAARPRDGADVQLLSELIRRVPSAGRVLDAGCGAGVPATDALRRAGLDVILDRLVPDPMGHGEHLFALVERRRAA